MTDDAAHHGQDAGQLPAPVLSRRTPPPESPPRAWPRSAVVTTTALAGVLALAVVFAGGYAFGRTDGGSAPVAATTVAPPATEAPPELAVLPTARPTPEPAAAPTPEPAAAPTPEPAAAPTPQPTEEPTGAPPRVQGADEEPVRTAVLAGGTVYLRGRVPDQQVAEQIAGKVAQIVGPGNVAVEYEVDPDAPLPASAPLVVEDRVLFGSGSATIREEFRPVLDLGVSLLTRFPHATITVIGHADPRGGADLNMALSQARVNAVQRYLVDAGIEPERVLGQARGEQDPLTDDESAEGLAANRRAEFVVNGLLDT